jgi:hypothetical protein
LIKNYSKTAALELSAPAAAALLLLDLSDQTRSSDEWQFYLVAVGKTFAISTPGATI